MSALVLIDTSCWVEYLNRPESEVGKRVRRLVEDDTAAVNCIVTAELVQGTRNEDEREALGEALEAPTRLEMNGGVCRRAGELGFKLRRSGVTVPVTDCLIAASAEAAPARLFTLDAHFEELKRVSSIELEAV